MESILRCENNLLERFHASIWFYIFSSPTQYSSISLYMPIVGMMLLLPAGVALHKWVQSEPDDAQKDGEHSSLLSNIFRTVFCTSICTVLLPYLTSVYFPAGIFTAIMLVNFLPVFLPVFACGIETDDAVRKIESTVLLLFSLQCGLVSLVCFPQGLILLISSLFITIPFLHPKVPKWLMILGHPVFLLLITYGIYQSQFGNFEFNISEVENAVVKLYENDNSNVYKLWNFSVLPVWAALWSCRYNLRPAKLKLQ